MEKHEIKVARTEGELDSLKVTLEMFRDAIGTLGHAEWDGTIVMDLLEAHEALARKRLQQVAEYYDGLINP